MVESIFQRKGRRERINMVYIYNINNIANILGSPSKTAIQEVEDGNLLLVRYNELTKLFEQMSLEDSNIWVPFEVRLAP